jgi:poly[(R)-3-hydroxyalkanoate] polymerase subunit PhaC
MSSERSPDRMTTGRSPGAVTREVGDRAVDAVLGANPFVRIDPTETLAATGKVAARALTRPTVLWREGRALAAGTRAILAGEGDGSVRADRRFADPSWETNFFYRRWLQAYLVLERELKSLPDKVSIDERDANKARFLLSLLADAAAPTNLLVGNPAALKRARKTRGRSLIAGARNLVGDLRHNGGMPSMVNREPFRLGETTAVSPGAVVHRTEVLELIQYQPTTSRVLRRPLVVVPPQINKFYILDLAPGRSLIEHAVSRGQQVFVISWRNPGIEHREWDLARYVDETERALAVARTITRVPSVNVVGACAGGITAAAMLAHLAGRGDVRVDSATFLVSVLDTEVPSTMTMFGTDRALARAIRRSRDRGLLEGKELARTFSWLRPNDLVWSYWINNYLLGNEPPAFDVLAWNADSTNLPAGLHVDFLRMLAANALARPNSIEIGGIPIDLRKVALDSYVVGANTDHITPWKACYRTPFLLGGASQFVLSSSGHIQALVNPPGNPKSRFLTSPTLPEDPDEWLADAVEQQGTWWDNWLDWLAERSGDERRAPRRLGSKSYPPLDHAPGLYVRG